MTTEIASVCTQAAGRYLRSYGVLDVGGRWTQRPLCAEKNINNNNYNKYEYTSTSARIHYREMPVQMAAKLHEARCSAEELRATVWARSQEPCIVELVFVRAECTGSRVVRSHMNILLVSGYSTRIASRRGRTIRDMRT